MQNQVEGLLAWPQTDRRPIIFGENVHHIVMKFAQQAKENLSAAGTTLRARPPVDPNLKAHTGMIVFLGRDFIVVQFKVGKTPAGT
jgi:hypothetical protein